MHPMKEGLNERLFRIYTSVSLGVTCYVTSVFLGCVESVYLAMASPSFQGVWKVFNLLWHRLLSRVGRR